MSGRGAVDRTSHSWRLGFHAAFEKRNAIFRGGVISARLYNGVKKEMANYMAHTDSANTNACSSENEGEKPRFKHSL